ncbi:MAG: alpha-amylase family glycosyl hydrolase [Atopobiaceae bacterium]|jgi:cyclomaltodextrinase
MARDISQSVMQEIGQNLKVWRAISGITADELGQRIGVSRDTVSRVERGDVAVSVGTVLDMCDEFGVIHKLADCLDPTKSEVGRIGVAQGVPQRVRKQKQQVERPWLTPDNWYDGSFVYQIYPLGLTGAPWANDGSDEGATNNDAHRLLKIINDGWVDHIKKLGASCVMLNPVFESDTHGYDTRDYTKVDQRLGTQEDLRRVVEAFHKADIKVLFDAVFNHVGRGFWAFQDVIKNKQQSHYAGWFNIDWNSNTQYDDGFSYETWAGVPYLVKLNHNNFELNEYLATIMRGWEADYDIDGLRLDVAYCLDLGFLGYLRSVANDLGAKRHQKFVLVGETMFGDYRRWMNDNACDSVYNYEAYKGLWSSMNSANMHEIAYALERQSGDKPWDLYTGKHLLNFVDNHDVPRIATQLTDKRQLKPLYGLLFGMCGVPCVYYGSEWGIEGEQNFGDHELRPALAHPEYNELTAWIEALAEARLSSEGAEALCMGDYHELLCQPQQLVFQRAAGGKRVIVAINASEEPQTLHFDAGCGRAVDLITGDDHDFGAGSHIDAFSCAYWLCER